MIDELTRRDGLVLGTGGGAVLYADSRRVLRSRGTTFYLHPRPRRLSSAYAVIVIALC